MTSVLESRNFFTSARAPQANCISLIVGEQTLWYALSRNFEEILEIGELFSSQPLEAETLSQFLRGNQLSERRVERAVISFLNSRFTLVPDAFAEQDRIAGVLKFTAGELEGISYAGHFRDVRFPFSVPQGIAEQLEKAFPSATITHTALACTSLLFLEASLASTAVLVYLQGKQMTVAARRNGELLYCNVYSCDTEEDVLYFVLFGIEQFRLSAAETAIALCGEVDADGPLVANLRKFMPRTEIAVPSGITLDNDLRTAELQRYFILLSQHRCAS